MYTLPFSYSCGAVSLAHMNCTDITRTTPQFREIISYNILHLVIGPIRNVRIGAVIIITVGGIYYIYPRLGQNKGITLPCSQVNGLQIYQYW